VQARLATAPGHSLKEIQDSIAGKSRNDHPDVSLS
jgi:hypothetical protein